jgi:hypothetical protein
VPARHTEVPADRFWVHGSSREIQARLDSPETVYLSFCDLRDPVRTLKSVTVSWEKFEIAFRRMVEDLSNQSGNSHVR